MKESDTESSSILSPLFLNSKKEFLSPYEASCIEEFEAYRHRLSPIHFDGAYHEQQGFSQEDDKQKNSDSSLCVTEFVPGTSVTSEH